MLSDWYKNCGGCLQKFECLLYIQGRKTCSRCKGTLKGSDSFKGFTALLIENNEVMLGKS